MANNRLTQEEFNNRIYNLYNGEYTLLSIYDGKRNDVKIKHKCGFEFQHKAGFLMTGKIKCPICDNGTNLTTDIVKIKIQKKYGNEYEMLDEYKNSLTPFRVKHLKCGNINFVTYSNFIRSKIGCYNCSKKCQCLSNDEFLCRIKDIGNGDIIPLDEYTNINTVMKFLYVPDNKTFNKTPAELFKSEYSLKNIINYNHLVVGENDLWSTHKYIAELLVDDNDGLNHKYGTQDKLNFKCPFCGEIIHTRPSELFNRFSGKIVCPKCGDGFSYPEKFVFNFLRQNNIDFIFQLSSAKAKWCKKYRYDFYLPKYNWIIEVDGLQHYKYKDIIINDVKKEKLALKMGICKYIHIDAKESSLAYLKNSILNSELKLLCNTDIDWKECGKYASNSLLLEICQNWNGKYSSIIDLSLKYQITKTTMFNYLKRGNEYGLIEYNHEDYKAYSKKESRKKVSSKISKPVICLETNRIYNSIKEAQDTFNPTGRNIQKVISGTNKTAYGYHWAYI